MKGHLLDPQAEFKEFASIQAESINWQPLGQGAYLHHGDVEESEIVIRVVGIPNANMAGMNVLLLV
ncbi:hypothetical protein [Rhodoferax sp.]|uniref:hypothetical protein n=1 Tax=Rhodoferax sp. TaxID=50421 RepID=UPI00261C8701|nr:hypothetical protein [Rhodoferax sp.]MDD5479265.1 hypothetical protein [Rhodoferax sp.]